MNIKTERITLFIEGLSPKVTDQTLKQSFSIFGIIKEGRVIEPDILKVDSFVNHQIDVGLMDEIACFFKPHFILIKGKSTIFWLISIKNQ